MYLRGTGKRVYVAATIDVEFALRRHAIRSEIVAHISVEIYPKFVPFLKNTRQLEFEPEVSPIPRISIAGLRIERPGSVSVVFDSECPVASNRMHVATFGFDC